MTSRPCGAVSADDLRVRCVLPEGHAGEHRATTRTPCECEHPRLHEDGRWFGLSLVGFQDDGAGGVLELRDCPRCHSTRARPCESTAYLLRVVNRYIRLRRMMGALSDPERLKREAQVK